MAFLIIPVILQAYKNDASRGSHAGEADKDEREEVGVWVKVVEEKEVDTVDGEDKAGN
jgi:hypothetical protein